MRIGGAQCAPPPSQTGQADLPHPAFQSAAVDGLAQAGVPRCSEGTRQPRSPCRPAHPITGGPLPADNPRPSGFPPHRRAQPCGTASALARWPQFDSRHCLPTSLGSTIITRFIATTDALTPTGPFVIAYRGSLIHVTRTSHHSVSNHPRFSTRRVPLPQRWPLYFVRASPCARKLAKTADRIEFTLSAHASGRRYGLVVHFQLLSTRGYGPDAVTFGYWPYSVGQVRDFHPAVPVRSQAHERGRLDRSRRRPADGLAALAVAHQTASGICRTSCSARRRTERPGRSRSPFPTASFRLWQRVTVRGNYAAKHATRKLLSFYKE